MLAEALAAIERLRELIAESQSDLAGKEAATRYAVIDPLLRMLGWDTSDPDAVIPEYGYGSIRVDYALAQGRKPIALVEAKSLHATLALKDLEQLGTYCYTGGVRWGILTNGVEWIAIDGHILNVPIDHREVLRVDLRTGPVHLPLQQLLSLHPLNLRGATPQFPGRPEPPVKQTLQVPKVAVLPNGPGPSNKSETTDGEGLHSLADIAGPGARCDLELVFPGGHTARARSWSQVLTITIEWLLVTQRLTAAQAPIPDAAGKKRYLVNAQPVHEDGRSFPRPQKLSHGLYYHTNYDSKDCCRNTVHVLERCGLEPTAVRWTPRS